MFLNQIKMDIPIIITSVPTWKIKGDVKVKIEIDDITTKCNNTEFKRINITCYDFQLNDLLHKYKSRNPIIIKKW